jgi:hypothetical protein
MKVRLKGICSIGFGIHRENSTLKIINNLNAAGYKDNLICPVLARGRYVDMVWGYITDKKKKVELQAGRDDDDLQGRHWR